MAKRKVQIAVTYMLEYNEEELSEDFENLETDEELARRKNKTIWRKHE